jgi:hypothetical protein
MACKASWTASCVMAYMRASNGGWLPGARHEASAASAAYWFQATTALRWPGFSRAAATVCRSAGGREAWASPGVRERARAELASRALAVPVRLRCLFMPVTPLSWPGGSGRVSTMRGAGIRWVSA